MQFVEYMRRQYFQSGLSEMLYDAQAKDFERFQHDTENADEIIYHHYEEPVIATADFEDMGVPVLDKLQYNCSSPCIIQ